MADPQQSGAASRPYLAIAGAVVVVVGVIALVVYASRPGGPPVSLAPETKIDLVSDPTGATVIGPDGGVLGVTPFVATLPKRDAEMAVIVRHEGYNDRRVTVPLFSATGRIDILLIALGADAAAPPKAPSKDWAP